jgi:hypothetical protein
LHRIGHRAEVAHAVIDDRNGRLRKLRHAIDLIADRAGFMPATGQYCL